MNNVTVFQPALDEMTAAQTKSYGPESFRDYIQRHDLEHSGRTPRYISVDSIRDLPPSLKQAGVMVLRLGSSPDGSGTQFLLVKPEDNVAEFFLADDEVFGTQAPVNLESPVDHEKLLSFQLLPRLSETSLVNLALASGVLAEGLELDTNGSLMPPATGRSTFTFDVKPYSKYDLTVTHRMGQVEIDTLFAERRNGDMTLFVIEAKIGQGTGTLAKHKLMYPILALKDKITPDIEIVPVYLRCSQSEESMIFRIAECQLPDPREHQLGIDDLQPERSSIIRLQF